MNKCISWGVFCVFARASQMAYNYARNMFSNPGSLSSSCKLFLKLCTLEPATFPWPFL